MSRPRTSLQPAVLKLFVEIAELGSFTKAALLRRTAQSRVSLQISQLERECGGRLFRRTGRGVALTDLGERIIPRVRTWLTETDQLVSDIKTTAGAPIGVVRIGILPSAAHPLITTLFDTMRGSYPQVRLSVREGQGDELDNWLETRAVDMAILFRYRKGARNDETYLATADTYLVGPSKDILTRSPTIEFSRLAGVSLVLPCRPSDWRNVLDDASRSRGFSLSVAIEADSLTVQKQVAIDGRVYAVLGPFSIARELSAGKLQASRIVNPELKRYVTLAFPMHGPTTLACKVVAQHIQQIARSIKWKR